jgi:hypothetical protein
VSGCAYADALQGAYQMAQATAAQWPDAAAFATAFLDDAVTPVRGQLRVTGIKITSMDQVDRVTAAYVRAMRAGRVTEGFLPPGTRAAHAAQATRKRGRRPGRRPDVPRGHQGKGR